MRIKRRDIQAGESTSPINADYGMNASDSSISQNSEKSIENGKKSLSAEHDGIASIGSYNVSGEDVTLQRSRISKENLRYVDPTATDAFLREVAYGDRHAFARSLANKTSDIVEGKRKTVYITLS